MEVKSSSKKSSQRDYPRISELLSSHLKLYKHKKMKKQLKKRAKNFKDPNFPASKLSLFGYRNEFYGSQSEKLKWMNLEWARPEEVWKEVPYQFFGQSQTTEVKGGLLEGSFLFSILKILSKKRALLERLFDFKEISKHGLYSVWLFVDGLWKEVLVDDQFPVKKDPDGNTVFAFSGTTGNELWVMVLEKAFAKVLGGYSKIMGQSPDDGELVMRVLTGAPVFVAKELDVDTEEKYTRLSFLLRQGAILTCYSSEEHLRNSRSGDFVNGGQIYQILELKGTNEKGGKLVRRVRVQATCVAKRRRTSLRPNRSSQGKNISNFSEKNSKFQKI